MTGDSWSQKALLPPLSLKSPLIGCNLVVLGHDNAIDFAPGGQALASKPSPLFGRCGRAARPLICGLMGSGGREETERTRAMKILVKFFLGINLVSACRC